MPELPEVETVVQTLREKITKQEITRIESYKPETVILLKPFHPFKAIAIERRGKYIIICGPHNEKIIIHLRMTGRLTESPSQEKFIRATIHTTKHALHFEDMRRFGRITFTINKKIDDLPGIIKLGPEPWNPILDKTFFLELQKSSQTIKSFLLDQTKIAGIGNIYADESCFHAGILPTRKSNSLQKTEASKLLYAIRYILKKAIYLRGTSFAHFIDANGKKGNNLEFLAVYGRKKSACFKCKTLLTHQKLQGRTTIYCTTCQK